MIRQIGVAVLFLSVSGMPAQSPAPSPSSTPVDTFDVATIKPVDPDARAGRYITMQGAHRFVAKQYTVKLLIAAAYNLNSHAISGGPEWIDSDHYDIAAITPGDAQPSRDRQMAMLRSLLVDRFNLTFHREQKEFSIYVLSVAKNGPKMKKSTAAPDDPATLISTVYPQRITLPARNASMNDFVSLLQRAVLDRPVVDKTGLSGKFDFDLQWAPDETQFGGEVPVASAVAPDPPFFTAIQQQLGLRLEAARGPVDAIVVDNVARPSAN